MKKIMTALVVGVLSFGAIGVTGASANHRDQPADLRHYDGSYDTRDGASLLYVSSRYARGDDRYARRDHRYGRRNGYRGRDGRILFREVYNTRYRARIVLVEEVVRTRRGPRFVCTVSVRGPQARFVSERRMHRIARRDCSPRARIRVFS